MRRKSNTHKNFRNTTHYPHTAAVFGTIRIVIYDIPLRTSNILKTTIYVWNPSLKCMAHRLVSNIMEKKLYMVFEKVISLFSFETNKAKAAPKDHRMATGLPKLFSYRVKV